METSPSSNDRAAPATVRSWALSVAAQTLPKRIHWCDGSEAESRSLEREMVETGVLVALNEEKFPRCFLYRSDVGAAIGDDAPFLCTADPDDAGPTNAWMSPRDAERRVWPLFAGCMRGRTMYVVPYLLGPVSSKHARVGVELTDSPYVAASLRKLTSMGRVAVEHLGGSDDFVRGIHSLGERSHRRFTVHFPSVRAAWSIGSGQEDCALLSRRCHALRLASVQARDEGWLAERMVVVGITSPNGVKHFVAAALADPRDNLGLAMLVPTLPGWSVEMVCHDVAWLHPGDDGRLWAVSPQTGLSALVPRNAAGSRSSATMQSLSHDVIFTNVALRENGTPWWEGIGEPPRGPMLDWHGRRWSPEQADPAAHPDATFMLQATQFPTVGCGLVEPNGVPLSAIVFGGPSGTAAPLVYEARDWRHGVYVGATMAASVPDPMAGGLVQHDPMGMRRFCGYNMGDYFRHWLAMGHRLRRPPRFFHVAWRHAEPRGRAVWPGGGDNIRVLKWILERVEGHGPGRETSIGVVPTLHALDERGMGADATRPPLEQLLAVDVGAWQAQAGEDLAFLRTFGDRLPRGIERQHRALSRRLALARS